MQILDIHKTLIDDYKKYLNSFSLMQDERLAERVQAMYDEEGDSGEGCIRPYYVQYNPSYRRGAAIEELVSEGKAHAGLTRMFSGYNLFAHQEEALRLGMDGRSFVVTSGTGSGKSLTFLGTIFNDILKNPARGVRAILVYPMNALVNSQEEEIRKYAEAYTRETGEDFPITYKGYTGQNDASERQTIYENPPHLLLTNYMMLELMMTRYQEMDLRDSLAKSLKYLVFDELHTYRGRQGSDVAMLIRRIKHLAQQELVCIGTSATMASGDKDKSTSVVASFASEIFDENFGDDQIVGEQLESSTHFTGELPDATQLQAAIKEINATDATKSTFDDVATFLSHPLVLWLENAIALERGEDGTLQRGQPRTLQKSSEDLATAAQLPLDECSLAIKNLFAWIDAVNRKIEESNDPAQKPILPYKIHQFISQASNVYVTLQPREKRAIVTEDALYYKASEGAPELPVFPVVFSRNTGDDFICVQKNFETGRLEPRRFNECPERITKDDLKAQPELGLPKRTLKETDLPAGYLILERIGESVWDEELESALPDGWFEKSGKGPLDQYHRPYMPHPIYFHESGEYSLTPREGMTKGWFIAAPLLVDPTAGIVFSGHTNESTKLTMLASTGRSRATSILTQGVLRAQAGHGVASTNRKLLSFVDARQDASLQSGYFNDLQTSIRLRSAVYHAVANSAQHALGFSELVESVAKHLALKEKDYARSYTEDAFYGSDSNEKALRKLLSVRLIDDLLREWKFTVPNLEKCALLGIYYNRLDDIAQRDDIFSGVAGFEKWDPETRRKVLLQVLNYFRTEGAIFYHELSDAGSRRVLENDLRQSINYDSVWSFGREEKLPLLGYVVCGEVGRTHSSIKTSSGGSRGSFGKYLNRLLKDTGYSLGANEQQEFNESLCHLLERCGLLHSETIKGNKGDAKGYQLLLEKVLWQAGDEKTVLSDEVRTRYLRTVVEQPNTYFQTLYQEDYSKIDKPFTAAEHTGQVSKTDRIDREGKFRDGDISALYCSPTMELGIDISSLDVVHMRNVPPTPANYAQRSGRAGRSGQGALVLTYCSDFSPHDRHYFKKPIEMVAGAVKTPLIDLANEDLLATHLNAFILSRLSLQSVKSSVAEIVDVKVDGYPIMRELKDAIDEMVEANANEWAEQFTKTIAEIHAELTNTDWFDELWVNRQIKKFHANLDKACERWRQLLQNSEGMIARAQADMSLGNDKDVVKEAERIQRKGIAIRHALLGDKSGAYGSESEFYVFRYLAAEGFLPGYNFTRLPVRAHVSTHSNNGQFIVRPRFLSLREFGPGNFIYHNGSKHRVSRMLLQNDKLQTEQIKISTATGYAWPEDAQRGTNNDPITGAALDGSTTERYYDLLDMTSADTKQQDRISCEEEERARRGYQIAQHFHYPRGMESTFKRDLVSEGKVLSTLIYGPSTQLIQINQGWGNATDTTGFPIDTITGEWLSKPDAEKQRQEERCRNVQLFATDTADSLYWQFTPELDLDNNARITLAYAIKAGIEQVFQIESSELGVWIMGNAHYPNILFYESAEGSLGVLKNLTAAEDKSTFLNDVIKSAYETCHFSWETRQDRRPDLPKATYDDLLSYHNQRHHEALDRFSIKEALEALGHSVNI